MNKAKVIVSIIKGSSFMLLVTAVLTAFRRLANWIKSFARPKEVPV